MKWTEVRVRCRPEMEEPVSAVLAQEGAGVCSTDGGAQVSCWLPVDDRIELRLNHIRQSLDAVCSDIFPGSQPQITLIPTSDEDWLESWREHFHAFACGGAFRIRPPWEEPGGDGLCDLIIDPGMAFGTGQHPTTEMMLEALAQNRPEGRAVLDVGAGSGILSIAAALLGAHSVLAVEVDPAADSNARRNITLNGVEDVVEYRLADASGVDGGPYGIVLMNIVADAIIRLAPIAVRAMAPGALFACSGIIEERLEEVRGSLRGLGLREREVKQSAEWRAVICELA